MKFRYLLGWTLPLKFALLKFLNNKFGRGQLEGTDWVCQDFIFKLEYLKEAIEKVDDATGIYPIWLCPSRFPIPDGMEHLTIAKREDVYVDIGIYG